MNTEKSIEEILAKLPAVAECLRNANAYEKGQILRHTCEAISKLRGGLLAKKSSLDLLQTRLLIDFKKYNWTDLNI